YLKYEAETDPYDGLGAGDDRALGKRSDPRETFTFAYQGVLSANTFLEVQATQKKVEILAGGDPSLGDPLLDANNVIVYNNHWWDFNDASVRDNETAALNVTHSLGTESFGSHTLEAGIQYVNSITGGENRQSSTGLNLLGINSQDDFYAGQVNGDPRFNLYSFEALRWEALPLGGEQELKNTALFVQDGITLGDFRFDLGLRYDQYDGSGPLPSFNIDFDGFSPRVGITYNINPSWQVQGTYGRYISRFNDNVGNAVTGVGSAPRITTLYTGPDILNGTAAQLQTALRNDANWSIILEYLDPTQPTTFVANDVEAPYADDYNLSIRHALARNTGSVVLSYINREYKNLLDDFRGGVCSDFGLDVDNCSDFTTVVDTEGQETTLDSIVWANNDAASREYEAITALWDYRPSSRWLISGNYTYAKTEGNYEGEGQNTPASGSIQGDFVRSVDQAAAVPFGYTDDDIRHRLIAMGSYTWDLNRFGAFSLGSIFRYRSGLPYSLTSTVPMQDDPDYIGDDGNTYTYYFGRNGEIDRHERNARRFDGFWAVDLSTRYELPVWKDLNVFLKLAVTNLTDENAVVRHQTSVAPFLNANGEVVGFRTVGNCGLNDDPSESCTGFGRIRNELDYQSPREFLFTVAVDF
ncbi:MAG TPA: TonB-dependent receptor, partial [Thermoanaerobaculia bacterium]|nr:TonB-dependent receptor [Thermoanaerobaculia bacterium]